MGNKFKCPVCKKPLTQKEYQRALHIVELQSKDLKKIQSKLKLTQAEAKRSLGVGIRLGRERAKRLFKGKEKTIEILRQRVKQLQQDKTPQSEGFRFEKTFANDLRKLFGSEDEIIPKGKEGDILQIVKVGKEEAGKIIYELKKTPDIKEDFIQQTHEAKREQGADFAVLVTSGKKKGFDGLSESQGIFIVAPTGALALAALLRMHLIEMLRSKLSKEQRANVARMLVKYINSPMFRNPIMEVVKSSSDLQNLIKSEAKAHLKIWQKRWTYYKTISWNVNEVRRNLEMIRWGKEPKEVGPLVEEPLKLPEITK
jgi:hypothetical protein